MVIIILSIKIIFVLILDSFFAPKQKSELYHANIKEFEARWQAQGSKIVPLSYPKFQDYSLMQNAKDQFNTMIRRGNQNWDLFQADLTIDLWPIITQEAKNLIKVTTGGIKFRLSNETKLVWCYTEIEVSL